jgi:hypothetical protein
MTGTRSEVDMANFEFIETKSNTYQLLVRDDDGKLLEVLERYDDREDMRLAAVGLFCFVHRSYKQLNDSNIDRLLFT